MKKKAVTALSLLLPLLLLVMGSGQSGGVGLIFEHIQTMGARQWLNVAAGSLVSRAAAVAPISDRIADSFPHLSFPFASAANQRRNGEEAGRAQSQA
jgi:hypothetical protein